MGDLFSYMVMAGIAGLAGSGVISVLNHLFEKATEKQETEKDGSITTYSWDAANDLYMCHHVDCNKYSRFYQQRIAFLKFMVTQPANLKKPFVDNDNYRICPHCEVNKDFENPYALMRSDAKWTWLETDPDCPMLKDSEDVKAAVLLISQLRKAIRENEEIASFQQYHGVESESIEIMLDGRLVRLTPKDNSRTLDLTKKVDTITADKISVPPELESVQVVHSAMRNFGVSLDDYLAKDEKPAGYDTSKVRGMHYSLDEENAHRVANGKEPRYPQQVEHKLHKAAKSEQEWAEWMRVNVYEKK